jgi:hypothetical protein
MIEGLAGIAHGGVDNFRYGFLPAVLARSRTHAVLAAAALALQQAARG